MSARTPNSRTFDNGNGTRTVELGQNLNFQSAPGQYSPVNLAFHQVGASMVEDGSQVTVKAATGTIDVTDRTSGVGLRWSTAGAATVSGTAVSVSSPGLSWTYSPTGSGLELSTLVSARRGPQTYTFNYSLLGGAQALSVDGQGELTSTAFAVSRPVVVGANGHVYQAGAWQITAPGQAQFAWDDSSVPANALPYVLDPAQYYFNAANLDETFLANGYSAGGVYSYAPNNPTGSGGTPWIAVADDYNGSSQYGVADAAVSWDTSSIPATAKVSSASFYIWSCFATGQDSIEYLSADWVSGQPMAPSAMYPPEINQGPSAFNPVSLNSLPWSTNYSGCVQGQTVGGENIWSVANPGLGIIPGGTTMMRLMAARNASWPSSPAPYGSNYAYFAGTGNAANYAPLLYVTYVVPPPAPTQLSTSGTIRTLTPQLTDSSVSDPDGDAPVNYAFQVNSAPNGGGSAIYNPGWLANTTSVMVPAGTLNWNQTYSWETCVYDGTSLDASVGAVSCSGWTNFTPVPYPPAVPRPVAPASNAWITSPYQFSAQPVSDPNGGSITYDFQVWNATQVVADSNWISSPSYTFSLPDGSYWWQVESRASEGPTVSGWTNRANYPFNVDTTPPPAPVITPAMVTWTSNPNASYSWTDSDSRVGGYAYTFATSTAASPGSSRGSGTSTTQSATSGGTWYFIIQAINNAGVAGPTATATYQYGTPPNAPTQVNAVASDGQAVINWLASTINGSPVTNYTVTATGVPTVTTTSTSATITGLTDGQLYSFNVGPASPVGPGPSGPANPVSPAAPPTGGGIGPLEQLGGCRCGYSTQDNFGQNVDAATGDFWTTHQDLSIPGRGPAINFAETYNSLLAGTNGPLGYGWTFSYGMKPHHLDLDGGGQPGERLSGHLRPVRVPLERTASCPGHVGAERQHLDLHPRQADLRLRLLRAPDRREGSQQLHDDAQL